MTFSPVGEGSVRQRARRARDRFRRNVKARILEGTLYVRVQEGGRVIDSDGLRNNGSLYRVGRRLEIGERFVDRLNAA